MERESLHDSPGRSPLVTHSHSSPVRSIHPELDLESLASQMDFGHRTADFFDDTTEDESVDDAGRHEGDDRAGVALASDGPRHNGRKPRRSGHYLGGTTEQFNSHCNARRVSSPTALDDYIRANPPEAFGAQPEGYPPSAHISLRGSVEELVPMHSRHGHLLSRGYLQSHRRASSPMTQEEIKSPIIGKQSTQADKIMGVHALTLKALQRLEEEGKQPSRRSMDRISRYVAADIQAARRRSASAPAKKVSMLPPPIDTSSTRHLLPDQIVRTPYPVQQFHRKHFGRSPGTDAATPISSVVNDSLLTLCIRRSYVNSKIRITTLLIPANSEFGNTVKSGSPRIKEKHFAGLDFDDMELFRQLNKQYRVLVGPYRWFSARSLGQIVVSGSASRAADAGYGWLAGQRSPRYVASRGLSDTFSEEKLLRHFREPKLGKARYAWVSWAHRLAAAPSLSLSPLSPPPPTALLTSGLPPSTHGSGFRNSMIRRSEQHEGLEFVMSWSAWRILTALTTIMLLSIAATLLWILLGGKSHGQETGFRDAGDRVGAGVGVGIGVLLLGLTSMAGWLGMSWLVM